MDDEDDITSIFKRRLEKYGFQVDVYNDPVKALSEFKPYMYDLLLLDIRMPGMSGFELYHEIKSRDRRIKACFLTAFETYDKKVLSEFPGLDEVKCFLKKPITIEELVKRITAVLEPDC